MDRRRFLECCGGAAAACVAGVIPGASRAAPIQGWARTVCDLCGLGDPVFLGQSEGVLVAGKGIPESPIGFGRLCPRARALWGGAADRRALRPMIRRDPATKGTAGGLEPASWDEALAFAGTGLGEVRTRIGDTGVAFLASDGETNEDLYLLSKAARIAFGTDHVDTLARLDGLHAYDVCQEVFGIPGNPGALEDVDTADLIVLLGAELAESHPSLFYRVLDSRRAGRSRVVVIDSRKTLGAGLADLHLRPVPGRELAAWNALTARLVLESPQSAESPLSHPPDWIEWLRGTRVASAPGCRRPLAPASASPLSRLDTRADLDSAGLDGADIDLVAQMWNDARGVVTLVGPQALSGPGGKTLARAVAQLHRATGRWGTLGNGPLFLPRGANAAGVASVGVAPGRLPGCRSLLDPRHRDEVELAWGADAGALPASPGLSALEWPAAIGTGRIGALVVFRANPLVELPASGAWRDALRQGFVVAASTHTATETEAFADVVLPLATVAGETRGTTTSLGRQVQLLELAVEPPGEARTTGDILLALVRTQLDAAEYDRRFRDYLGDPHRVGDEWRRLSAGTPVDVSGITSDRLRRELGPTWPCRGANDPGLDRFGPDSATRLRRDATGNELVPPVVLEPAPSRPTPLPGCVPLPTPEAPFLLLGGPIREHFRSRIRTGSTPELHYEAPAARVEMHPADGGPLGLRDGDWITVSSSGGALSARVWLVDRSPQGVLFVPEHFGFRSDLQGGSDGTDEPEGGFHLVSTDALTEDGDAPAGALVAVSVRPSRRGDMRRRGLRD